MKYKQKALAAAMGLAISVSAGLTTVEASSHREAPSITEIPKVDGTDLYMFRSYGADRTGEDFVTIISNYQPLQDNYGGPNYFTMDPDALYEIHIDNDGDAQEDITFQFRFNTNNIDGTIAVPDPDNGPDAVRNISVPVINIGAIGADGSGPLFRTETYTVDIVRNGRRNLGTSVTKADGTTAVFEKPVDNIGNKSFDTAGDNQTPDNYNTYANSLIHNDINIPGCDISGSRVFVGQRQEGFSVNLGEVFDLVNTNPLGRYDAERNIIGDKNITSIALEIPTACLTNPSSSDPVIGAWMTASLRQARVLNPSPRATSGPGATVQGGAWTQVSRLGNPLVNELVIGVKDKDQFNASHPSGDTAFLEYVQFPALGAIIQALFPITQAPAAPRADLVAVFLTGNAGLNQPTPAGTPSEVLRLNTSIAPKDRLAQSRLGFLGESFVDSANPTAEELATAIPEVERAQDVAGFPNGRRPGDDVVDIALRVVMGYLVADAQNRRTQFTDGATVSAGDFLDGFPYLNPPIPGNE